VSEVRARRVPHERRVACAESLLRERNGAAERGWPTQEWLRRREALARSAAGGDSLAVESLLLVRREWLRAARPDAVPDAELALYGEDTFSPLLFVELCESARLWGYTCPFVRPEYRADHMFPKALGGPTESRNRLTLCEWHNTAKSMDVHIFPFEEGTPAWVSDLLS